MVIFGTRGKVIDGSIESSLEGLACGHCGNKRFTSFGTVRYFHLFWLPMFPTAKTVGLECVHCKNCITEKQEIPSISYQQIRSNLFTAKKLFSTYFGSIILAILVSAMLFLEHQEDLQTAELIKTPKVNDVYVADFTKIFEDVENTFKYGALKITNILSTEEVECLVGDFMYSSASAARNEVRKKDIFVNKDRSTNKPVVLEVDLLQKKGVTYYIRRKD